MVGTLLLVGCASVDSMNAEAPPSVAINHIKDSARTTRGDGGGDASNVAAPTRAGRGDQGAERRNLAFLLGGSVTTRMDSQTDAAESLACG